jgi:hypothetical protein
MQGLLEYLELILTGAGLVVIGVVFAVFRNLEPWKAAGIAAILVGFIHGIVFFVVRSAQRRERQRAIIRIRHTFDDLVRNKLQAILFATEIQGDDWRPAAQHAVQEIHHSLDRIEAESLRVTRR